MSAYVRKSENVNAFKIAGRIVADPDQAVPGTQSEGKPDMMMVVDERGRVGFLTEDEFTERYEVKT